MPLMFSYLACISYIASFFLSFFFLYCLLFGFVFSLFVVENKYFISSVNHKCVIIKLIILYMWVVFLFIGLNCRIIRIARQFLNPEVINLSLVAQTVKRLPTVRETRVRSLGQEGPLEKEMATQSSTLAWKIPWTEEPRRLQSMGSQRVGHDWVTSEVIICSYFLR